MAFAFMSNYLDTEILSDFVSCMQGLHDDDVPGIDEPFTLLNYIQAWLGKSGMAKVGGDYTIFLQAVLVIIDAYQRDPSILDYAGDQEQGHRPRKRRVKVLVDLQHSPSRFLEPYRFRQAAMAYARCRR